ncbi:MAG: DMT family transporter [Bacteroidetes bacterium]|nr:DMT family transporter [Bacteroidota bacterium]
MLNNKFGQFFILIVLGIVWGSSFILMKKGLIAFNSWQVASMRLFFAGLIAVPFFIRYRKEIEKKDWIWLALAGFIGNGFPAFMFTYAQKAGVESSLAGALNALTPVFTLIVGVSFFNIKSNLKQIIGLFIGLLGAVMMIFNKTGITFQGFSVLPFLIVFLATFFYGINLNIIKSKIGHIKPILAGMIPLSIVAFPATGVVFASGVPDVLQTPGVDWNISLAAVFVLGIVGTALSLFVYNALIQKTNALFGAAVNYMLPFVAAIWGVLDGEAFGKSELFSLCFILGGIYLIRGK